jgi:hypothetical protein
VPARPGGGGAPGCTSREAFSGRLPGLARVLVSDPTRSRLSRRRCCKTVVGSRQPGELWSANFASKRVAPLVRKKKPRGFRSFFRTEVGASINRVRMMYDPIRARW